MNNNYLVVMAGGVGSRLWPLSSVERPKQFLDIFRCGRTLLQLTVDRFQGVCPIENTFIVTSESYVALVKEQLPEIPESNILREPCRRNTAPSIAYVSWKIKSINPRANIVVAPSDHMIVDTETFQNSIRNCMVFTAETDAIITLGVKPVAPETGYGYLAADLSFSSPRNHNIYRVDAFREKPDAELAAEYIKAKNYFWNAGIFIWSVHTIINAFRVYQPETAKLFQSLLPYFGTDKEQEVINVEYPKCEDISIDFAIMEKAEEIFVYPVAFDWSDLGSWSSVQMKASKDIYGNAALGTDVHLYESSNCIVYTSTNQKVVVQGLDNFIVVEKDGEILICKLSEEQRIKLFH